MELLTFYLVLINSFAYIAYGIDKNKAIKGGWRIPESTLLAYSIIGGGVGSIIAMKVFRHKTEKLKFVIGVPLLTLLSIGGIYLVFINIFA